MSMDKANTPNYSENKTPLTDEGSVYSLLKGDSEDKIGELSKFSFLDLIEFLVDNNSNTSLAQEKNYVSYAVKNKFANLQASELKSFFSTISSNNRETQFDLLSEFWITLSYTNIWFEKSSWTKGEIFSSEALAWLKLELDNLDLTPFLSLLNESYFERLCWSNIDWIPDFKVANAVYAKTKLKSNSIKFKGENLWTISRVSSDYLAHSFRQWIWSYASFSKHEEKQSDENEIYNDRYRLTENFRESYLMEKHNIPISRLYEFKDKDFTTPDCDFSKMPHAKNILASICNYILDNEEKNSDRLSVILKDILWTDISSRVDSFLNKKLSELWWWGKLKMLALSRNAEDKQTQEKLYNDFGVLLSWIQIDLLEDKRTFLDNDGLSDILNWASINIFWYLDTETLSKLVKRIHSPIFLASLSDKIWYNLTELTLQEQVHLARFLWDINPEKFSIFKDVLSKASDKKSFLTTFLACSEDLSLWDKIIELASFEWSDKIFKAYSDIVSLQWEVNSNEELVPFLRVILARWKELLIDALKDWNEWNELAIASKYETELVRSGAFLKVLLDTSWKGELLPPARFNELSPDFHIEVFTWWWLIRESDNVSMVMEDNYLKPELFDMEDLHMIMNNIDEAYKDYDRELIKILYKDIPDDLNDPSVTFYTFRLKNLSDDEQISGKWKRVWDLLALCKIKDMWDWTVYAGTNYVEPDYRWHFWAWSYVAKLAFNDFKDSDVNAFVARNNPSLEAQVNHTLLVWTKLKPDIWHGLKSWLVLDVSLFRKKKFKTKNRRIYNEVKLRHEIWVQDWYEVMVLDSRPWFDEDYVETLNDRFSKWKYLTRVFYDRKWKSPDLSKTYVVFEDEPGDE